MPLVNTKSSLLITLWSVYQAGGRNYTTMSWHQGLKLLVKYHHISVKRRWFFYCMRTFIDEGLIARKPRYNRGNNGSILQLSSLITFTLKGLKHLSRNKVTGAFKALKNMINWLKSKDNRFPRVADVLPDMPAEERVDNIRKLKLLLKGFGVP